MRFKGRVSVPRDTQLVCPARRGQRRLPQGSDGGYPHPLLLSGWGEEVVEMQQSHRSLQPYSLDHSLEGVLGRTDAWLVTELT